MKYLNLLVILSFSNFALKAQITVGSGILPSAGDKYYYYLDTSGAGINLGSASGSQSWDFSNVLNQRAISDSYVSASGVPGSNFFPTANLASVNQGTTLFYRVTNKNLELLGTYSAMNPFFGGPNVFDKPAVIIRTPMDYQDQFDYTVNQAFQISGSIIPDSLTMGLTVDSIRIKIKRDVLNTVDAWGKANLKSSTYDVLRLKIVTKNTITVEAKVAIIGWIDITSLASGFFGGFLNSGVSTQYVFVSNQSKGYIATVDVDSTGSPTQISYKAENVSTFNPDRDFNSFSLKSNLVSNLIEVENISSSEHQFDVDITNLQGTSMIKSRLYWPEGTTEVFQSDKLIPGQYNISIRNKTGQLIWQRAILKITN
ncbi:MAG: hypothetical protein IT267_05190 [Saprospiraceae bacterium]|nr:hypothetical protein [Saprospiraceae bacterium]